MAMPLGAFIEIGVQYDYNTQRYLNILHYEKTVAQTLPTTTPIELTQILTEITGVGAGTLKNRILDVLAQNCNLAWMSAQEIFPLRSVLENAAVGLPGGVAIDALTGNISAVITKYTDFAGRDQIGSFHLPCPQNNLSTNGVITDAPFLFSLDLLRGALTNVITTLAGASYKPVICHKKTQPMSASDITGAVVQDTVRVMRRRTVRVGI